jgi:hypothetical protein
LQVSDRGITGPEETGVGDISEGRKEVKKDKLNRREKNDSMKK